MDSSRGKEVPRNDGPGRARTARRVAFVGALVGSMACVGHAQAQAPIPSAAPPQGQGGPYEPQPAPPATVQESPIPGFSVRVDPLNALLWGRLGLELEIEAWKYVSIESVPMFVVNSQPPFFNVRAGKDDLYQHSNGLGAMSGLTLGVGFWLEGKAFEGSVLRLSFTNYAYKYETEATDGTPIDSVNHVDRRAVLMFGSHRRWGAFTLASGFGLGWEFEKSSRCLSVTADECSDDLLEVEGRNGDRYNLYGFAHPLYFDFRLSLGLVF